MDPLLKLKEEYLSVRPSKWSSAIKNQLIEDFTFHSSKLEGLKLGYGDTIQYLRKGLIQKNSSAKDIADLKNHRAVLTMIFNQYDSLKLNVDTIKLIHGVLMADRAQWGTYDPILGGPGELKLENNWGIREGEMKEYLDADKTAKALEELCSLTNMRAKTSSDVISAINQFHFEFLNLIHPFSDGNGRMARLLHNMLLLKNDFPVLIIKDSQKKKYVQALIDQEGSPDKQPFHVFMNAQLEQCLKRNIQRYKSLTSDHNQNKGQGL